jgi:hypothetical protein
LVTNLHIPILTPVTWECITTISTTLIALLTAITGDIEVLSWWASRWVVAGTIDVGEALLTEITPDGVSTLGTSIVASNTSIDSEVEVLILLALGVIGSLSSDAANEA